MNDVLIVIVPEAATQLFVIHFWFVLPDTPSPCDLLEKNGSVKWVTLCLCCFPLDGKEVCVKSLALTSSGSVSLNSHSSPVQEIKLWQVLSVSSSKRNCHSWMGPEPVKHGAPPWAPYVPSIVLSKPMVVPIYAGCWKSSNGWGAPACGCCPGWCKLHGSTTWPPSRSPLLLLLLPLPFAPPGPPGPPLPEVAELCGEVVLLGTVWNGGVS